MSFHFLALGTNLTPQASSLTVILLGFHFRILLKPQYERHSGFHLVGHLTSNFESHVEIPPSIPIPLRGSLQTLESLEFLD